MSSTFDLDICLKKHNGLALYQETRNEAPVRVQVISQRFDLPNYYDLKYMDEVFKGRETFASVKALQNLPDHVDEMPGYFVIVLQAASLCHKLTKPGHEYISTQIYKSTDRIVAKHITGMQPGETRTVIETLPSGKHVAGLLMLMSTADLSTAVAMEVEANNPTATASAKAGD